MRRTWAAVAAWAGIAFASVAAAHDNERIEQLERELAEIRTAIQESPTSPVIHAVSPEAKERGLELPELSLAGFGHVQFDVRHSDPDGKSCHSG